MPMKLNRCDLSGVVLSVRNSGHAKLLNISQKVADRFETNYLIVVDMPLSSSVDVGAGDEVAVLSAVCYSADGSFRFRISEENQFIITKRVLNKGTVNAEDLFI